MSSQEFVDPNFEEVIELSVEDLKTMKNNENINYVQPREEDFKDYVMSIQTNEDLNSNERRKKTKLIRQQRYVPPDPNQQRQKTTDIFTLRDLQEEMRDTA